MKVLSRLVLVRSQLPQLGSEHILQFLPPLVLISNQLIQPVYHSIELRYCLTSNYDQTRDLSDWHQYIFDSSCKLSICLFHSTRGRDHILNHCLQSGSKVVEISATFALLSEFV